MATGKVWYDTRTPGKFLNARPDLTTGHASGKPATLDEANITLPAAAGYIVNQVQALAAGTDQATALNDHRVVEITLFGLGDTQ